MSNVFSELESVFEQKRIDLTFNVDVLDTLTEKERKTIEENILEQCMLGNNTSYKYIPYLKYSDPIEILRDDSFVSKGDFDKSVIYKNLYHKTGQDIYLNYICDLAINNPESFSMLTFMYLGMVEETLEKQNLLKRIKEIAQNAPENYRELYEKIGTKRIPNFKQSNVANKKVSIETAKDGIIGFAVGDALGVPVEFTQRKDRKKKPITTMKAYGTHYVPEGTWSDDTSMTIAFMDSVSKMKKIDYDDIMKKFCDWMKDAKYTATDKLFDIGISTSRALNSYIHGDTIATESGSKDEWSNGNGSLMRMIPVAYYMYDYNLPEYKECEIIDSLSSLTHGHEISKMGCKVLCDYVKELLSGRDKKEAYEAIQRKDYSTYYSEETVKKYSRILDADISKLDEDEISSSGYVVSTLEACLWCTLNNHNYRDSVISAVNLGNDTDTIGAITGGINGIIYQYSAIPEEWLSKLRKKDYLEELTEKYVVTINEMSNIKDLSNELDGMLNTSSSKIDIQEPKKIK